MADRLAPSLKPLLAGLLALAAGSALALTMLPATALAQAAMTGPVRSDPMQTVGAEVHVRIETLPKPYATPAVANPAVQVPRPEDQPLRAPRGFTVTLFRDHVENARNLLVLPNGDVLVAQQRPGSLTLLRMPTATAGRRWPRSGPTASTIPSASPFMTGRCWSAIWLGCGACPGPPGPSRQGNGGG